MALEIVSRRLRLTPFTRECITHEYVGWLNDKGLMAYSRQRLKEHTYASCLGYLEEMAANRNLFWSIQLTETGEQIGTMTAYFNSDRTKSDLGILIGSRCRGAGYGSEAWGAVCDHLIHGMGVTVITGGTSSKNIPMLKIFEHWGMKLCGDQADEDKSYPGKVLRFAVHASDWNLSQPIES